jgi:hypothetical protein
LTELNKSLKRTEGCCRYQNIAGTIKAADNFTFEMVESLPEVAGWKHVIMTENREELQIEDRTLLPDNYIHISKKIPRISPNRLAIILPILT